MSAPSRPLRLILATLGATALLAACGGGDDGAGVRTIDEGGSSSGSASGSSSGSSSGSASTTESESE